MGKRVPFEGFAGPTNVYNRVGDSILDCQRSINLYPEVMLPTSKSQAGLVERPGLSQTGYALTLANSPVRALWAGNNRLFAVGGTHFYELSAGGGVTTDYGAMAGSTGAGRCIVKENGTQLLVYDSSSAQIYNANIVGPAMNSVFNATALEYLDGFYVAIAFGASLAGTNPNQINVSALGDGTTWNALNYVIRTGASDLTTALAVLNGQLWIFGEKSIEVWYNAGNPLFPFARIQGATINRGLMSPGSIAKFDNTIVWLSADDRGYAQVHMTKGLAPVRVSTAAIESLLSSSPSTLPLAWAYGYEEAGHTFYVLTLVSASYVPLSQLVYDLTTGLWHERIYSGAFPVCFASVPGFNSNGPNFVGDGTSGKVMFQGLGYTSDLGTAITCIRTAPHASNLNKWTKYSRFELDGDFGTANPTLDWSNDGGRNFGSQGIVLTQPTDQGTQSSAPTGRQFFAMQLGRSRDRVFRVTVQDSANRITIAGAYLDIAAGSEA